MNTQFNPNFREEYERDIAEEERRLASGPALNWLCIAAFLLAFLPAVGLACADIFWRIRPDFSNLGVYLGCGLGVACTMAAIGWLSDFHREEPRRGRALAWPVLMFGLSALSAYVASLA